MREILGNNLEQAMKDYGLCAVKTYQSSNEETDFCQVWEVSDDDFKTLCDIPNSDWKDEYGWWRSAEGSNMGFINQRYNINHHYIKAWDGIIREKQEEKNKILPLNYRRVMHRNYSNLLEYFSEEIGASTEKNVTALATDLAFQNGIKLSELFIKYQGV